MSIQRSMMRWLGALSLAVGVATLLSACGGGGGGDSGSSSSTGGGTSGSSSASNQVPIKVAAGVGGIVNMPTVSVTICAPGTSTCQTIDNVLVDTASYGVRIMSSAASNVLGSLPTQTANVGGTLAECGQFVSSYTWGTVRTADVKVGGEAAGSLPIQILGDLGNVPSTCSNGTASANSPSALGANGILGIGPAPYDCGSGCVTTASVAYWGCSGSSCQESTASLAQQVSNPVHHFADNTGVIISMNTPSGGTATGTLTFGIGTQSNNALPSNVTKLTSTTTGDVTGTFLGRSINDAFFDTGSNGYFFDDSSIPTCSGNASSFYCPSSQQNLTATVKGLNGAQTTQSIVVQNANTLFATGGYALPNLAGPFGNTAVLDFGLPHFYGHPIYFGMDLTGSGGASPYVAM